MKVLFLDIDGVLNSASYFDNRSPANTNLADEIDPKAVDILNDLVQGTGATVVLSSDWRKSSPKPGLAKTSLALEARGASFKLFAATPELSASERRERFGVSWQGNYTPRGLEIQVWLDANPGIESFVILDDEPDMEHLSAQLVQTDPNIGLTLKNCEQAATILGAT